MEMVSMLVGVLSGCLAVAWRPDSEGYVERFLKAIIPPVLAIISMAIK